MKIIHKIDISAARQIVFSLYKDVNTWPLWDDEIVQVSLPKGLQVGSVGWIKPRNGLKLHIKVIEMTPDKSFTIEGRLPLCRVHFGHVLDTEHDRTRATHWVDFSGPLAFLFRRVMGNEINATLPHTMAGLKRASEDITEAE